MLCYSIFSYDKIIDMFYAYLLQLSNNQYYAGHSEDLKRRMTDHKNGKVMFTKRFRPLELVFYAAFKNKDNAIAFEKYLKSSSGKAFRNKRLI